MKIHYILLITTLLGIGTLAKAQTFEVPQNYVLKDKGDYPKYQPDVLKAIDWIQQTPFNEQGIKRKEVNSFLIAWISGTPDVSIEINDAVTKLAQNNNDMLIIYMAGYTKYVLENPADKAKPKPHTAGVKMVLAKYKTDKSCKKDKALDKLVKLDNDGGLETWVSQAF